MLIIKRTLESTETPAQIWRVLEDVETWKSWDREIEFSQIDGQLQSNP